MRASLKWGPLSLPELENSSLSTEEINGNFGREHCAQNIVICVVARGHWLGFVWC